TITSTITFTNDVNNTSILIRPSCGATRTLSGNISGQFIYLNGADNVTIDGLNTGGNALVIENTNNIGTSNVSTIQLNNDAQNVIIRNCEIMGSSIVAAQGVISVLGTGINGCDNLLIENNKIHQSGTSLPTNVIYLTGTAATVSQDNITIQNNEIYNFNITAAGISGGVAGFANLHNVIIQNNHFYIAQTLINATSGNELRAIMVSSNTSDGINILNNYIGGSSINAGGTPLIIPEGTMRLIRLTVGTAVASNVQGNTIRNISLTTISASTAMSIINVVTGKANILDNVIGSTTTNGSITINSNGTGGMICSGITTGTGTADDVTISNNTIAGLTLTGSNPSTGAAIRGISVFNGTANARTYTVTNNKIGSPTQSNSLQTNLASATVTGIFSSTTNAMTHYLNNNRIFNLASVLKVNGIELTGNGANYNVNNNRIEGLSASASTGIVMNGIVSAVSTPSVSHIISGDTIANFSMTGLTGNCFGVSVSGIGNYTISANRIYEISANSNIAAPTVSVAGINCLATGVAQTIAYNRIYAIQNTDLSSASLVVGINFSTAIGSTNNVSGNFVHSLNLSTSNTSGQILGIMHPFTNLGTTRIDNNMVRLGIDKNGNSITIGYGITGIRDAAGTNSYYYNSVLIAGTGVVAGSYTADFAALATTTGNVRDVRNNLFINTRSHTTTSPTIRHYAISILNKSNLSINYNGYYTNGIDGMIGNFGLPPVDVPTLCEWRTAMTGAGGADANSIWGDPLFVNGNGNVSAVDLHITPLSTTPIESKGTNITTVNTDYDFATRNATTPDLGADEGAFTVLNYVVSINLDSVNSICEGNTSFSITYNTPVGSPNKYSLTSSDMATFVSISDAALPASPITATIPSGVSPGVYHFTLTVKNYEYCVSATYLFTLTIVAQPSLVITNPAAVCAPSTVNLTATTVTAGSTLPSGTTLSYWTNMAATIPLANPNAVTTSNTYYIKATKGICSDIEPVTVTINPSPVLSITDPLAVCAPNTVDLTDVNVTLGSSLPSGTTLTYWTNSGATISLSNPNAVAVGNIYYIKAEASSGCFDIEPVTVTIDPTPNLVITNPSAVCSPNTVDLTAAAVTAGSTLNGGTLSYWSNSIATTSLSNPSAVAVGNIYYIKAETGAGCVDIESVTVTINASPATPSTSDKCSYGTNLTLSATGSGGTLQWYNANATSGSVLATGSTYNATTSGTYYVFEQNGMGCYSAGAPAVATLRAGASTNVPTAVGDYWATDIVQEGTWTHYCRCADDYRILSLELNGQNIGTNLVQNAVSQGNASNQYSVRLHITAGTSVHVPNTVPYIDLSLAPLGWWLIPRAWDVFPHTQPTSAVGVRSYYTIADYNNLNTDIGNGGATPLISHSQLTMYKLQNLEAAPNLDAAHAGITQPQIKLYANWTYYAPWTPGNLAPTNPSVYYGQYPVPSFSGGGGGGGSQGTPPFPITLLSFTGKPEGTHNILTWITSSELNAAHFEVEHSIDGITFEKMGQVKAKGFSTENTTYTFTDKFPYQGSNVYRLKMLDNDGAFKYSNNVEISNKLNFAITLYPNPVKDKLQLTLSGVEGAFTFKLYNAVGQLVMQEKVIHNVGDTETITLKNFTKGAYLYQIIHKGEALNGKLLIEE
ncbi:MAG: T9SS type A sorting domain-containing protein, partial [Bacteroidia bacterium]